MSLDAEEGKLWEPVPTTGKVLPDDVFYLIPDPPTNGIAVWRSCARLTELPLADTNSVD